MSTHSQIEDLRAEGGMATLGKLARLLGYRSTFGQLDLGNGSTVSDVIEFLQDNPGAVTAVIEFALEHGRDRDGNELDDEDEEDTDEEGENEEEEG